MTKKNGRSAETPPGRSSAEAVRAVAETLAEDVAPVEFRLANGCLLGIKPVAPFLIRRAVTKLDRPSPPKVLIQDKGREEEVPDDPAYMRALAEYRNLTFETGANVLLAAGTWLKTAPAGVDRPEDEGWVETAQFLGVEVDVSGALARYLSWLNLYAITSEQEYLKLMLVVSRGVGLTEEEVQQAMSSFRGLAARGADNGLPTEDAGHRNRVRKAAATASP